MLPLVQPAVMQAQPTDADMLVRAQAYVGLPYVCGVFDCADLAARVQWELFGRVVPLPVHRKRPAGAMGQAREIAALRTDLADPLDAPETGCGVLMYEPRDDGAALWHIGTAFMAPGTTWVLHNSFAMGNAALQRLADLQRFGLRLEGYYRWRAPA